MQQSLEPPTVGLVVDSSGAHWRRTVGCVSPVSSRFVSGCGRCCYCLFFIIAIRHLRGFWFSRKLRGDQGQARALADGRPSVDGLGTVGRQHASVLPNAACDGQAGLVPHGFCEC